MRLPICRWNAFWGQLGRRLVRIFAKSRVPAVAQTVACGTRSGARCSRSRTLAFETEEARALLSGTKTTISPTLPPSPPEPPALLANLPSLASLDPTLAGLTGEPLLEAVKAKVGPALTISLTTSDFQTSLTGRRAGAAQDDRRRAIRRSARAGWLARRLHTAAIHERNAAQRAGL